MRYIDSIKYETELNKLKVECKCGHKMIFPKWINVQLCDWCGRYIFRNQEDEFKYRLKERLK